MRLKRELQEHKIYQYFYGWKEIFLKVSYLIEKIRQAKQKLPSKHEHKKNQDKKELFQPQSVLFAETQHYY